jgi:peptidoglycan/xylan/chitin deacetylase (PgdA/CDA1 family)
MRYITTSWDDGHPADLRLAALLAKYDLKATFYIPRSNEEHPVMEEKEIVALSQDFEIGGHTLHHVNLERLPLPEAVSEIRGCFEWLRGLLGKDPISFCPPFGAYGERSINAIYLAGFRTIRTTELLSTGAPMSVPGGPGGGRLLHTTLQAFPHSGLTYFKHLLLRRRLSRFEDWRRSGCSSNLLELLDHYLDDIQIYGGCFHLWGHSWEIEENNLWDKVEQVFQKISHLPGFTYVENKDLATTAENKDLAATIL